MQNVTAAQGGPGSALDSAQSKQRRPRLVLHFDIHNTILMKTPDQPIKSIQFSVAKIICQSAWGRLIPAAESDQSQIPNWQLAYD